MDSSAIDQEELKVFVQEAEEQLQLLDEDIIRLEKEAENADLLQEIFRAAHTLKGSSGMLGFRNMAELTHHMEDVLDRVRKGLLPVSPELVDALLGSLDGLKELMGYLGSGHEGEVDISEPVAALQAVLDPGKATGGSAEATVCIEAKVAGDPAALGQISAAVEAGLACLVVRANFAPDTAWGAVRAFQVITELSSRGEVLASDPTLEDIQAERVGASLQALLATAQTPDEIRSAATSVDDIVGVEVVVWEGARVATVAPEPIPFGRRASDRELDGGPALRGRRASDREAAPGSEKIETLQTIRIDVDKLDALMNLVGELVIDRTRVTQITKALQSRYRGDEVVQSLEQIAAHIGKMVEDLHEGMLQARMLPIGTLFSKFPRLVRDVARSTGKQVEFVTEGEDTEIDRAVIEKIKDPLIHLLRNAVDHGIESPEARVAAGKPASGTVKLSASHDQGRITIQLVDDGSGIDARAIKETAVRKGIIAQEAADRMSEQEALDLIFASGLSTAAKATDISGRGVGMDVVRTSIEGLNGMVMVDTRVGAGSTFTLQLPLTLATFRGLLVESVKAVYAIPLSYVQETGRLEARLVETIVDKEVVNLRGTVMPLFRLSVISPGADRQEEQFMVIVRVGDRPAALAVDRLMDQQEVVVKSLGNTIGRTRGVAGASILGDGEVALILDVATLMKAA
jgi:two-component system chemotaxis sensor kinase CheA